MKDGCGFINLSNNSGINLGESGNIFTLIIYLIIIIANIAGGWKMYEKAGKPGWSFIIPIYNIIVFFKIAEKPLWWILLLLFIPIANLIVGILVIMAFLERFSKPRWHVIIWIILPYIYVPYLGFSDAQYSGTAD